MNKYVKQPAEAYYITVDFSNKLPSGTTLSSGTVTGVDLITQLTDDSILSSTTCVVSGSTLSSKVLGGTHGKQYLIRFTATLNNGSILNEDVKLFVVDSQKAQERF